MNTLQVTQHTGQLNGGPINELALGDGGGTMLLTLGRVSVGEMLEALVNVNFPTLNPRVCIPAETNVAKAGC